MQSVKHYNSKASSRAFTLVELMVTLGFLSFALLGVTSLQIYALRQVQVSADITIASNLVNSTVEELWLTDFDSIADTAAVYYRQNGAVLTESDPSVEKFAVTVTLETDNGNSKDIKVSATWKTHPGAASVKTVETYTRIFQRP